MKILSVFDGISCGRVALGRAGIPVERYVAYEIDKYAIAVSKSNYPDIEHCGDVFEADFSQYEGFDVLIGGSPCTHWSIARNGRETTSSGIGWELFMQYVRALRESGCKWFLYENNFSIHKDIQSAISKELGILPIMINSALVSAQNRRRLYWTNIPNVEQPMDRGMLLKDVLESGDGVIVSEQGKSINKITDKSYALLARDYKGFGNQAMTGAIEPIGAALRTYPRIPNGEPREKRPEIRNDKKSNCITRAQTDSMACIPLRIGNIESTAKDKNSQQYRVYSVQGKSVCLCGNGGGMGAKTGLYKIDLPDGDYIIRKLTPVECERLQTLPDDYTAVVSNTQRYKGLGNGWTVDVIAHILSYL